MLKLIQQLINGLSVGSVYALIAVGYSLVYSILSFSNFSHGGFMVIGAYAGFFALTKFGFPTGLALAFSIIAAGVVAVIAERLSYRPVRLRGGDPLYFMIASLGVGILIQNTIIVTIGPAFKTYPPIIPMRAVHFLGLTVSLFDLIAAGTAAIGLIALEFYINKTKAGIAIRSAAYDMRTAGLMGINVDMLIMKVFFLSGMLAGLGGMFLGIKYTVFPTLGNIQTKAMIGAIFGGLGSISGAIYGSLILGVLEVLVAGYISSTMRDIVVFVILIIVLILRPTGLKGRSLEEKV